MGDWVKLTKTNGKTILVNLARATTITTGEGGRTCIQFTEENAGLPDSITVAESPEQVMAAPAARSDAIPISGTAKA